jgi:hypothetical protein
VSTRPTRLIATATLLLAACGGVLAPTNASAQTDDSVTIRVGALDRGEDPAVPQLLGTTVLHEDVRLRFAAAQEVQLFGMSGDEYIVGVWKRNGEKVLRVAADGTRETVAPDIDGDIVLSRDGEQVLETVVRSGPRSVVRVFDARTGDRLARRAFRGAVQVLDADEERAVLGIGSPDRTLWWHTRTDGTERISRRVGYFADIGAARVATLTGDPYAGGCSVLAPLSAPRRALWRSCEQGVLEASPDGRRLLTTHLLMDGPLGTVAVHGQRGRRIAAYRSTGWFGPVAWESDHDVLLATYGARRTAIVRCRTDECERASRRVAADR